MQNKLGPWHVATEEANQTGILATGGDIGILSQACTWDSPTSFPLHRDPTPERSSSITEPAFYSLLP